MFSKVYTSPTAPAVREIARNLLTNPRFKSSGAFATVRTNYCRVPIPTSAWSGWAGNGGAAYSMTTVDDPRFVGGKARRYQQTAASTGPGGDVQAASNLTPADMTVGTVLTASFRYELQGVPAASQLSVWFINTVNMGGGTYTNLASGRIDHGDGTFTQYTRIRVDVAPTANVNIGLINIPARPVGAVVLAGDCQFEKVTTWDNKPLPFFVPGTQFDADLEAVWAGAVGSSNSILRGKAIAGVLGSGGRSQVVASKRFTDPGDPAAGSLRVIANGSDTNNATRAAFSMLPNSASPGRFVATRNQDAPLLGTIHAYGLYVERSSSPYTLLGNTARSNVAGSTEHSMTFVQAADAANIVPYMTNGSQPGAGDVYWTLPCLVADPNYAGPAFHGSSGAVLPATDTYWDGVVDNSVSVLFERDLWIDTASWTPKRYAGPTAGWVVDTSSEAKHRAAEAKQSALGTSAIARPPSRELSYLVQRYGTWEWLDLEAELETDGPEWALSSYGVMDATLPPMDGRRLAVDGRPMFEEWGTLIHVETAEQADRRRWTGIVVRSELKGARWNLKVREFPAYLVDLPVEKPIRAVLTDPAQLVARIWQDIQAVPDSDLGVEIVGSTPLTVGSTSSDELRAADQAVKAARQVLDAANKTKSNAKGQLQLTTSQKGALVAEARRQVTEQQRAVDALIKAQASQTEINAAMAEYEARVELLRDAELSYVQETATKKGEFEATLGGGPERKLEAEVAYELAVSRQKAVQEKVRLDGGAYTLGGPGVVVDAQRAVQDLTKLGFEWTTATRDSDGKPVLQILIHHPRAGRQRDDLVFEQGVNILSPLDLVRGGEEYANAGVGIGAGEGSGALTASIGNTTRRMRRPAIVEDRSLRFHPQLVAALGREIRARSGEPYVPELLVEGCAQTPLGSWQVGDDILVTGEAPSYGPYSEWHRIVSWGMKGPNRALLRLQLSSTF